MFNSMMQPLPPTYDANADHGDNNDADHYKPDQGIMYIARVLCLNFPPVTRKEEEGKRCQHLMSCSDNFRVHKYITLNFSRTCCIHNCVLQ